MSSDKIVKEKIVLDMFRKTHQDFPKGRLYKFESPDFILKTNAKKSIGIELTELFSYQDEEFLNKDFILTLLAKKEEKITLYKKHKLSELWLLMYFDQVESARFNRWIQKHDQWNINTHFNKIYLFELFERRILQLK